MGFIPSNKKNQIPIGQKFIRANSNEFERAVNNFSKGSGNISDPKNLKKLNEIVQQIVKSNFKFQYGHMFLTVASTIANGILNTNEKHLPLTHYNDDQSNSERTIIKTYATIGNDHSKKLKSFLNGPVYDKFKKVLCNTREDYLKSKQKKDLYSKAGINQRNFTFLSSDCFLTIADILELTNFSLNHKKTIADEYQRILKLVNKDNESENLTETSGTKRLKRSNSADERMIRHYAGLLGLNTHLKIYNNVPVYKSHVIIHLIHFKNYEDKNSTTTISKLIKDLYWSKEEKPNWEERIPNRKIKEHIKSKSSNFSEQLVTTLDVNLTQLETFNKHCEIVRSWARKIPSGGIWEFNLNEKFSDGIYLNRLYELDKNGIDKQTPINHFFLIESYGDPRASVYRKSDKETFNGVYSPIMLGYDFKVEIEHLAKATEQDELVTFQKVTKSKEFLDESIGLEFYPNREESLNINFNQIDIGNESNKENPYKLELNSSILENQKMSQIENIINRLGKFDPEKAKSLTEDDYIFVNPLNDSKENEERGLRGKNDEETPYNEDEHH